VNVPGSELHSGATPPPALWRRGLAALSNRGLLSIVDQGVVSAANFATSVVVGRVCRREELGDYFLALSILYFVRGVQDQMLAGPYTVYSPKQKGPRLATYTGSVLMHHFGLSLLMFAGLVVFLASLTAGFGPAALISTVCVLLIAAPFILLREYIRRYSFVRYDFATVISIDAIASCVQVGGLLLLAWTGLLSSAAVYVFIGAGCAVASGVWLLLHWREIRIQTTDVISDWWFNWKFGRWALTGQLVGCSAPYIIPWIVVAARGEASTGVMAACTSIVGIANTFVTGLANYISPRAAKAYADGGATALNRVLSGAFLVFTAAVGSFALLCLFAGDWMLAKVYGGMYQGFGIVLAMYAGAMLANAYKITAGNGLWAIERPDANFAADVAALVVSLALAAWLTPLYGVTGAAAATLVGTSIDALIRAATLLRLQIRPAATTGAATGG